MPPTFLWQCAPQKRSFVFSRVLSNQVRLSWAAETAGRFSTVSGLGATKSTTGLQDWSRSRNCKGHCEHIGKQTALEPARRWRNGASNKNGRVVSRAH
eukprot:3796636-Pyramimonas_sp.AAC.1